MDSYLIETKIDKDLTPAQQSWLDGIVSSMMNTIENELEPIHDTRSKRQQIIESNHYLINQHLIFNGALREAKKIGIPKHQFPEFIQLWTTYWAQFGKSRVVHNIDEQRQY